MCADRCFSSPNESETSSHYTRTTKQKTIFNDVIKQVQGQTNFIKSNGVNYNQNFGLHNNCLAFAKSYDLLLDVTKGKYFCSPTEDPNWVSNEAWSAGLYSVDYSMNGVNIVVDTSYNAGNSNRIIFPMTQSADVADISWNGLYPGVIVDPSYNIFYNECNDQNNWRKKLVDMSFNNTNYYKQSKQKSEQSHGMFYPGNVRFGPPICGIIDISTIATNTGGNNWSIVANKTIEICQILNIDNGITLTINPDVTLTVKGTIKNNGTITLINNCKIFNNVGSIIYNNAGGVITLTGNFTTTPVIDNSGKIENSGTIDNNIRGVILNNTGGIINNNAGGIINIGFPASEDASILNRSGGIINNNTGSIINNNGGTLPLKPTIKNEFGGIINNDGGTINNTNGGFSINNEGTIANINGGIIINGGQIKITITGTITNSSIITSSNPITNDGGITNNAGGIITINAQNISNGGTFTNNGQINIKITGNFTNNNALTNNGIITLDGGASFFNSGGIIENNNTITNNGGGINNIAGSTFNNNGGGKITNNGGTFKNSTSSIINNKDGGIITNKGTINNSSTFFSGGGTINNNFGGIIYNNGGGTINNTVDFAGPAIINNNGALNSPTTDIGCGIGIIIGLITGNPIVQACPPP